jgi:hypothetical protein
MKEFFEKPFESERMLQRQFTCLDGQGHMVHKGIVMHLKEHDDKWILDKATALHRSWHPRCDHRVVLSSPRMGD